jgi:Flp pilus assembly protein TadB
MNYLKLIAVLLLMLVVVNLVLFALGKLSVLTFWFVIIGSALIAFYIIPNLKEKQLLKK